MTQLGPFFLYRNIGTYPGHNSNNQVILIKKCYVLMCLSKKLRLANILSDFLKCEMCLFAFLLRVR